MHKKKDKEMASVLKNAAEETVVLTPNAEEKNPVNICSPAGGKMERSDRPSSKIQAEPDETETHDILDPDIEQEPGFIGNELPSDETETQRAPVGVIRTTPKES